MQRLSALSTPSATDMDEESAKSRVSGAHILVFTRTRVYVFARVECLGVALIISGPRCRLCMLTAHLAVQ